MRTNDKRTSSGITIKTPAQIAAMRRSGRLVARTLAEVGAAAKPGATTLDLDRLAERIIRSAGGVPSFKGYNGFPGSVCASVNDEIVHGIPGKRTLREGDILSLDIGAILDGWHGDSAVSVAVGGVSAEAERLMRAGQESLQAGIAAAKPNGRLTDIGAAIEACAARYGFGIVREYVGHGIGRKMHEPPQVVNYGPAGQGPVLRPGMTLAIEPMLNAGGEETRVLGDKWTVVTADGSLSVHFEHTVVITEDGVDVLTRP
jgi:methionyl aminopeptidase